MELSNEIIPSQNDSTYISSIYSKTCMTLPKDHPIFNESAQPEVIWNLIFS